LEIVMRFCSVDQFSGCEKLNERSIGKLFAVELEKDIDKKN